MYIQNDKTNYTNDITRQKITLDELCQGNKELESIFSAFDKDKSGSLEGKELKKLMDLIEDIGAHCGSEDVINDGDIRHASVKNAPFKNINEQNIKTVIKNFLKINDEKVKLDFDEDAINFAKSQNLTSIENNSHIIPRTNGEKGFQLIYNRNGKPTLQTIGEKAGRYTESGYYEIYYDIKDNKGNVILKNGLYDKNNNFIASGKDYKPSDTKFLAEYATFRGMGKTNCPYLFDNGKGTIHHFDNGVFRPIGKLLDSDENGYLCQMYRKSIQGYVRDFTETIGYYKGQRYESEAEYYIAKNNLNIEVKKDGDKKIFVSKTDKNKTYKYVGNGQFQLSEESILAESKKYNVNGKLDKPIYQRGIGNCYMVSTNQGLSKYFPTLLQDQGIITPQQKSDDLLRFSTLDPEKDKFDADQYVITFPGVDNNPILGTKKHYTITREELQAAINSNGEHSSVGDPDEILLELAYKKMRTGIIETLIKKYEKNPRIFENPRRLANLHNNNIGNAHEYRLSTRSIQAYLEGSASDEDILSGGTQESILKALMPKGTDIKTIYMSSNRNASEIIEEYRNKNYMILASYKTDTPQYSYTTDYHAVLYDNEAQHFISTYDPNSFDKELLTKDNIDKKVFEITVVKIPDKK